MPADDRGLLLGDGLFETVRIHEGQPFRLERHLSRLEDGARRVGIPVPNALREEIGGVLAGWAGREAALRVTLTRGSGMGLAPPTDPAGRLLIAIREVPPDLPAGPKGLTAVIAGRLDERALTAGLKALGYLERIQALRHAEAAGADEALLMNSRDFLVEGSASNLLAVRGEVVVAPGSAEGALAGITREVVLEGVQGAGMAVEERGLGVDELPELSELLVTSSLRGIAPVIRVEGRGIGEGVPGPVFRELLRRYRAVLHRESRGPSGS